MAIKEQQFYRQLVYGVVENKLYIDYIIKNVSDIKINKIDKFVLNALRVGVYELYFLRSKSYAVINEIVNIVKKRQFKSKNFVNAILRNIDRDNQKYSNLEKLSKLDYLSIKYSINMDLLKYLISIYGNSIEEVLKSINNVPEFSIRVDTNKISIQKMKKELENKGYVVNNSKVSKNSLIIDKPVNITGLEFFKKGYFTIQDQSSALVSEILNPCENSTILDLCAAPGSKSTHLAQISKGNSKIFANDILENKLYKIKENFERMGYSNYELSCFDASKFNKTWENKFDFILVDAPCSGLGVIKRKPEIKLNRTMKDILEISNIQKSILENAYSYLKKGGKLVYSTCTVGEIENEKNIFYFLKKFKDMNIEKIDGQDFVNISLLGESDGFFICKMVKNE